MSLTTIFLASFAFGFAAVITPGPVSTAIVSQAPRRGWTVGPLVATGHSIAEAVIMALVALGLTTVMDSELIQIVIAFLGGGLLVWMGWGMVFGAWQGEIRIPGVSGEVDELNAGQMIRLGFVVTLVNPFWYAWWITSVPAYMIENNVLTTSTVMAFFFGHISGDYVWDTFLSGVVASGKRWITDRVYQGIIGVCGAYLIYLGILFIVQGWTLL